MKRIGKPRTKRATVLVMVVGLLAMLFMLVTAYIALARFDRQTVRQLAWGQKVEEALSSLSDMVEARIARSGSVEGADYATIPGYGGSKWLATLEPVRDPANSSLASAKPGDYLVGSTNLGNDPNSLGMRPLAQLMLDGDRNGSVTSDPYRPTDDDKTTARQGWMDADGDGVPDTRFTDAAMATEMANAIGGKTVRAEGLDATQGNLPAWQYFEDQARYVASVRVVPHGGMVLAGLDKPPDTVTVPSWNLEFVQKMFQWVKHPDAGEESAHPDADLLGRVYAAAGSIEPLLRQRNGLLIGARSSDLAYLPPALRELQNLYQRTISPLYSTGYRSQPDPGNWQRFNLAASNNGGEWSAWRLAVSLDADAYNDWMGGGSGSDPRTWYQPRRLLTTVNFSDELAREQESGLSNKYDPSSANPKIGPGIDPGQVKFNLGRIVGAFHPNGYFDSARGPALIREAAGCFNEMLAGHRWAATQNVQYISQRHQAYMLAVNTFGFAAPRIRSGANPDRPGFVDTAWTYDDLNSNGQWDANERLFIGYGPQPLITQVMAYREPDPNDPNDSAIALAVELFNPDEAYDYGGPDDHSLYLPQFAISLNSDFEIHGVPSLRQLEQDSHTTNFQGRERLCGRDFLVFGVRGGGPAAGVRYFENQLPAIIGHDLPVIHDLPVSVQSGGTGQEITVKLWRQGRNGPNGAQDWWTLVDEVEIDGPAGPQAADPNDPNAPAWRGSWVDSWRDTRSETYWGADSYGRQARWRSVAQLPRVMPQGMGSDYRDHDDNGVPDEDNGTNRLSDLGGTGPGLSSSQFGPTTPLWTMNARLQEDSKRVLTSVHGADRPPSFPTVGFMLFVPRYSHTYGFDVDAQIARWRPAGWYLYKQWERWGFPLNRCDLGHMPVFDNLQASSGAFAGTDRIPWGLLVYDYFTTIDPLGADAQVSVDDLDPYRVPGRINVNQAPWYVLAGLPIIGPMGDPSSTDLSLGYRDPSATAVTDACPAFWKASSGVLAGIDAAGRRFAPQVDEREVSAHLQGAWYRLGPWLGQAVAAYRDRVPYNSGTYTRAQDRNKDSSYRGSIYGDVRGQTDGGTGANAARGFLSLGELANVVGFDSTSAASAPGGYASTVLATGDFFKSVSLMALLDTHFLTTRSNTYTVYVTLVDRENPQASIRSQVTVDRSSLLPKLSWKDVSPNNGAMDPADLYTVIRNSGQPETIGRRQVSYFNARYDD